MNGLIMSISGVLALIVSAFYDNVTAISTFYPLSFALAWTVIIGNIFGYTLYAHSLKRYSATFVALAGFSIPLFVALFGYFILQEPLTVNFFIALAITFIGLILFYHKEIKQYKH